MKKIIEQIYNERKDIFQRDGVTIDCNWFASKVITTLEDVIDVFYHPDAVSICQENNYPSRAIIDYFKRFDVERFGIYIDAGHIELYNPEQVILIGDTKATIKCDKGACRCMVMHSAKAEIVASGWSVVTVHYNTGCEVKAKQSDRGILTERYREVAQ